MSFFKKKITLSQLIADSIFNSIHFYDSNSDKLISMSDELKVLDRNDMEELKELGYALIIADLQISCAVNFNDKISNEKIGEAIGFLYGKYLKEIKKITDEEIDKKMETFLKLLTLLETNEENDNVGFDKVSDSLKLLLCTSFAKLYSGDNLKDKKAEGKNFAAFKLAKAIVKADLVGTMLKDFKVIIK